MSPLARAAWADVAGLLADLLGLLCLAVLLVALFATAEILR